MVSAPSSLEWKPACPTTKHCICKPWPQAAAEVRFPVPAEMLSPDLHHTHRCQQTVKQFRELRVPAGTSESPRWSKMLPLPDEVTVPRALKKGADTGYSGSREGWCLWQQARAPKEGAEQGTTNFFPTGQRGWGEIKVPEHLTYLPALTVSLRQLHAAITGHSPKVKHPKRLQNTRNPPEATASASREKVAATCWLWIPDSTWLQIQPAGWPPNADLPSCPGSCCQPTVPPFAPEAPPEILRRSITRFPAPTLLQLERRRQQPAFFLLEQGHYKHYQPPFNLTMSVLRHLQ